MFFWVIPLLILIFFEAIADIFAKEWSLGNRSFLYAALALFAYMLGNSSWLVAMKYGSGLARGAILFSLASALLATGIGIFMYKEELTNLQILGVALGLISIVLLFWE